MEESVQINLIEAGLTEEEDGIYYHYYSNVVPAVGSTVSCFTSRKKNGDYQERLAEPFHVLTGTVQKVEYIHEERGHSPSTYRTKTHVNVYIEITDKGNWQ